MTMGITLGLTLLVITAILILLLELTWRLKDGLNKLNTKRIKS